MNIFKFLAFSVFLIFYELAICEDVSNEQLSVQLFDNRNDIFKNISKFFELNAIIQSGTISPPGTIIFTININNKSNNDYEILNPIENLNLMIRSVKPIIIYSPDVRLPRGATKTQDSYFTETRYNIKNFLTDGKKRPIDLLTFQTFFIKANEKISFTIQIDKIKVQGKAIRYSPIPDGIYALRFFVSLSPIKSKYKDGKLISLEKVISIKGSLFSNTLKNLAYVFVR